MKVICKYNKGADLLEYTENWKYGFGPETECNDLKVDDEYKVYGMYLSSRGSLHYLLLGEAFHSPFYQPSWYSSLFFDITDSQIPEYWYYKFLGPECPVTAIWGYDELVNMEGHYDGLIEREIQHLQIFKERKKITDNEYSEA